MHIETPLKKVKKISYRYSLEDTRKPLKCQIMRLLIYGNNPTLLYFYEPLLKAKEDYQLCKDFQAVHDAFNKESTTLQDDFQHYSNEGLISFEEKLSQEMQGISIDDDSYEELLHTYNTLHDELMKCGLVEFPF